ncbi:hypothetical protein FACS189415_1520 [Bacteroidia bacterium]|nr:hypothetical protein FACS189415_1520 [Bacteroidia bacterium]
MSKKNDYPKELRGFISPEKAEALKQLVEVMKEKGYKPFIHLHPPAGVSLDYLVIDFIPIEECPVKH